MMMMMGLGGRSPPEADAILADKVVFFGAYFEQTFQINMQLNSFSCMLLFPYKSCLIMK